MTKKDTSSVHLPPTPRKVKDKREAQTEEGHFQQPDEVRKDRPRRSRKKPSSGRAQINLYSMYESSATYILDDLNSIALYKQRFYNLLKMKPKTAQARQVKCRCEKSKCGAKYCECFAEGQVCSSDCSCLNCLNTDPLRHVGRSLPSEAAEISCRCTKSECVKNYCECFQRGQSCSIRCQCKNCLNYL